MIKKPLTFHIVHKACFIFFKIFYPFDVENGKSLPKDKGVIVCSNHISNIDPFLINVTQNRMIRFMAKQELFNNKLSAFAMRGCGAFPVDRGHSGAQALSVAEDILHEEDCLGIFIEGTRSKTGEFGKPRSGAFRVAFATKKPIIPCCITSQTVFAKPFKRIKVSFGEPLSCEDLGLIEGTMKEYRAAGQIVMNKISELREKQQTEFREQGLIK